MFASVFAALNKTAVPFPFTTLSFSLPSSAKVGWRETHRIFGCGHISEEQGKCNCTYRATHQYTTCACELPESK